MKGRRVAATWITLSLLTSCANAPAPSASWRFAMSNAPPQEQRFEKLRCSLSTTLGDGTRVELGNFFGNFLFAVTLPGANFAEFVHATMTLSSAAGTLTLPARPLVGGTMIAPLSDASDPGHRLVSVISLPFRVTAQLGGTSIIDEQLPAVPAQARQGQGLCLTVDYKITHGDAIVGHDAAGRTTYTIPPTKPPR